MWIQLQEVMALQAMAERLEIHTMEHLCGDTCQRFGVGSSLWSRDTHLMGEAQGRHVCEMIDKYMRTLPFSPFWNSHSGTMDESSSSCDQVQIRTEDEPLVDELYHQVASRIQPGGFVFSPQTGCTFQSRWRLTKIYRQECHRKIGWCLLKLKVSDHFHFHRVPVGGDYCAHYWQIRLDTVCGCARPSILSLGWR